MLDKLHPGIAIVASLGLFIASTTASANPGGDGGIEVWVDGPDAVQPGVNRISPDVAMQPDGVAVYVWNAFSTMVLRNDIFLRRFDAGGHPLADPVQVNTLADDDQDLARIAVSADGSFMVIWQSEEFDTAADLVRRWIRGQAYAADATKVGPERLVSAQSTGHGSNIRADVAALTGGGYVVVWEQAGAGGADTNVHIRARLLGSDGAPAGDSFVANSAIGASEVDPAVTELDGGGFLVLWTLGGMSRVTGRVFDATGLALGDDVQLDSDTQGAEFNPDTARATDGRILVIWEDEDGPGDDYEIRGRMFTSTLSPLGADFRINTLSAGVQRPARVGSYGSRGFLVAWESEVSAGDDLDGRSVQGRTVTGNAQFGGPQFQLNRWTEDSQAMPAVGGMGEHAAVAWHSGSNAEELNDDVITGQTWSVCGIFCDSFE